MEDEPRRRRRRVGLLAEAAADAEDAAARACAAAAHGRLPVLLHVPVGGGALPGALRRRGRGQGRQEEEAQEEEQKEAGARGGDVPLRPASAAHRTNGKSLVVLPDHLVAFGVWRESWSSA